MRTFSRRMGGALSLLAMSTLAAAAVGSTAVLPQRDAVPSVITQPRRRRRGRNGRGSGGRDKHERQARRRESTQQRVDYLKRMKLPTDRLGNFVSLARQEKKALRKALGLKTGRAWRRWLKAAQRGEVRVA